MGLALAVDIAPRTLVVQPLRDVTQRAARAVIRSPMGRKVAYAVLTALLTVLRRIPGPPAPAAGLLDKGHGRTARSH